MDTDSFILYIKIDTSNYGKKVTLFVALKLNTYLTDSNDENKKVKDTKTCVIKGKVKCANYDKKNTTNRFNKTKCTWNRHRSSI